MDYTYAACSHPASAVNFSLSCNFISAAAHDLVIVKNNHVEVYSVTEEGLNMKIDTALYGRITAISPFRFHNSHTDVLFILTESKNFCVLEYDAEVQQIVSRAKGNVKDRVGKDIDNGPIGMIDPDGKLIAMLLYEGLLKIVPIENTGLKEAFNLRIEELRHVDIKFLHGYSSPTVCLLYEDNKACRHLNTYVVDIKERELVEGPWNRSNVEFGAHMLVPVSLPYKGVIVIGRTTISYLNGNDVSISVGIDPSSITACCAFEGDNSRFLLGDRNGHLSLLLLCADGGGSSVTSMAVEHLGTTSIPESISSLGNGLVFVGSCFGDSQIVKLLHTADESHNYVQILDHFSNIGPIMDMCVIGSERQERSQVQLYLSFASKLTLQQIITCSGGYKDGSLRVVRSGICINEQASIDIEGIKGVWSLKDSQSRYDSYLVQSYAFETRILKIDGEEMSESEVEGFNSSESSLFCGNMAGNVYVQVTPTSVLLVDATSLKLLASHSLETKVTVAVGSDTQLVFAQAGGQLTYMELDVSSKSLAVICSTALEHDIACLSLEPIASSLFWDTQANAQSSKSSLLTLGLWTDNSVRILSLPHLHEVQQVRLGADVPQVRDVMIAPLSAPFVSHDHEAANQDHSHAKKHTASLLIGLGNGTLITFSVNFSEQRPSVLNRQDVVLGSRPLTFSSFTNDGALCVFVCCDQPTVIFSRRNNDSLLFSPVNIRGDVSNMIPFNSVLCPDCLAMSSETGLLIGSIDSLNKIHVEKYPLGEAPGHICHHKGSATLAVCTTYSRKSPRGEESMDRILFLDDKTMEVKSTYELEGFEHGASCFSCPLSENSDATDAEEFIVVGTTFCLPDEQQPTRGRILLFSLGTNGATFSLVTETMTKGAVLSLASLKNKLVAGVDSKVHIYRYTCCNDDGSNTPELMLECGHHGHVLALYVKAKDNIVVVGDLLRSVCLLRYKASDGSLEEIARDFNSNYMRSVEIGDGNYVIGAEDHGNIFILKQNLDAKSEEEKSRLDVQSGFHVGDYINVFVHGSLSNTKTSGNGSHGSILFGTVSGSIGALAELSEQDFKFLSLLEKSLKYIIKGVGGLNHDEWRNFYHTRRQGSRRTIDGNLIELFLDLSEPDMQQVVKHLNDEALQSGEAGNLPDDGFNSRTVSVEFVVQKVEELVALH